MKSATFYPQSFSFSPALLPLALAIAILTGCQTTSTPLQQEQTDTQQAITAEERLLAERFAETGQWLQAADLYRQLAEQAQATQRSEFLQKAALMMYQSGDLQSVTEFYQQLNSTDLVLPHTRQRDVLLAGIALQQGKTYRSLSNLPAMIDITEPTYQLLALEIRAQGLVAIGKPLDSALLRMEASALMQQQEQLEENQESIWEALNRITEANIVKALEQHQGLPMRGWLELNLIARRSNMLPARIQEWVKKWHERYPGHQAASYYTDKLLEESRLIYINPTRIALMLPLQNKYQNVAEAIQNGFLYAYYQEDESQRPELEIVNASLDAGIFIKQYEQAIAKGANFVVGPLSKPLVNELHQLNELETPTLALNYADDSQGINNLYQFGLSPENEAEQIAEYALVNGQFHAVTLTPDTSRGQRQQKAFTEKFESLGGIVVGQASYPAKKNDYSDSIKKLLHLNNSDRRRSILQAVLGENVEFNARRRQDVDMIFMAGNPRQARLIKPQLKFHHANDLPVYATSSITSGRADADVDRDLNEVLYVDMPWALNADQEPEHQQVQQLWPNNSDRYASFFALGIDAYRLIPSLRRLMIKPEENLAMHTGNLTVDKNGRVQRQLLLATFEKGLAKLVAGSQ